MKIKATRKVSRGSESDSPWYLFSNAFYILNQMKKAYQYLYYRAYDLLSLTGNYDLAWGASHFLSLIFMLFISNVTIWLKLDTVFTNWL